jgi:PTH1 family peptidyl-tRNA hydrolase
VKLLIALGNPGERYRDTRHNAGWWLADHLVNRWSFGRFRRRGRVAESAGRHEGRDIAVLKPLTFMNRSGQALRGFRELPGWEPETDLLVLVDDLALEPGRFRLRGSGSAGGHNGLLSIEGALRSQQYARFRIGVGAPADRDVDRADWVLSAPRPDQEEGILAGFDLMSEAVECWLSEGVETAMNRFNRS